MYYSLLALPINRYFWFDGDWMAEIYSTLFDASGNISPVGQRFALPPDPTSGGCPVRR